MKKSRFSEEQIVLALKQVEGGVPVREISRKYGLRTQPALRWSGSKPVDAMMVPSAGPA